MLSRSTTVTFALLGSLVSAPTISRLDADDIPTKLIIDARVIEARSLDPDFKAMEELSFFINTDGVGVTEEQWLATLARQASESFLATLAFESHSVVGSTSELQLDKRSRSIRLSLDLSEFAAEGVFGATVTGALVRSGQTERSFERDIELRVGQTYVWSGRDLELSGSEYLSHFRDYGDRDDRSKLYDKLRDYATFLIVAYSLRIPTESEPAEHVTLELPTDVRLPELKSTLGIEIGGTVELELELDDSGAPRYVTIARSSIPEVNSQILREASTWRFAEAQGKKGRLSLELKATP